MEKATQEAVDTKYNFFDFMQGIVPLRYLGNRVYGRRAEF